ncbi:MAG: HIT family protein [Defluviitaleaceae bacterium]|nr:HIT family protein [Defluviitaleaceae bacterium]
MECIFCKIINNEIPSHKVYEDDYFKAILDIFPASKGHTIIIPKKHTENLLDLEEAYLEKILPIAKKIAKDLGCEHFNILQNNGEYAGQTVFHYHMHIIPRKENDKINIKWETGKLEIDY